MKTAIVYAFVHYRNTKKLVDAIASKHDVTLIDVTQVKEQDMSSYDLIGFASGIYFFKVSSVSYELCVNQYATGKRCVSDLHLWRK